MNIFHGIEVRILFKKCGECDLIMDTLAAVPPVYSMIIVTDDSYVFHVCSSTAVSELARANYTNWPKLQILYLILQKQGTVRYS
jgi:hypothetical protein